MALMSVDRGQVLYVIGPDAAGPCKIGRGNAKARRSGMQTGNHLELHVWSQWRSKVLSLQELEKAVHRALVPYHIRGEWFDITTDEAKAMLEAFDDVETRDVRRALAPVLLP